MEAEKLHTLLEVSHRLLDKLAAFGASASSLLEEGPHAQHNAALVAHFPSHPSTLDAIVQDRHLRASLREIASSTVMRLEPWYGLMLDVALFDRQANKALKETAERAPVVSTKRNLALTSLFMDVFTATVRIQLLAASLPRSLLLSVYVLYYSFLSPAEEPEDYSALLEFIEVGTDSLVRRLQVDFEQISQRVGVILDAVAEPTVSFATSKSLLGSTDIFTLGQTVPLDAASSGDDETLYAKMSGERAAMDVLRFAKHWEWAIFGLLVCPGAILRHPSLSDLLRVILSETLVLNLHGHIDVYVHQLFQTHVQTRLNESTKEVTGNSSASMPSKRLVADCFEAAARNAALLHRERRVACIAHLGRITLTVRQAIESMDAVTVDLSLSEVQTAVAMLLYAQYEVQWYYRHADAVQVDIVAAFERTVKDSSVGASVDFGDRAYEGTDIGSLVGTMLDVAGLLYTHSITLRERIRSELSRNLSRLKASMAIVLVAPDLPSPAAKGLLRQVWTELVAFGGMSEESASRASSTLTSIHLDWLRLSLETSSAAGSSAVHDLEGRIAMTFGPTAEMPDDGIGCIEYLSHLVENCVPLLSLDSILQDVVDCSYLLDVPLERLERLERGILTSTAPDVVSHATLPLRLYGAMDCAIEVQMQQAEQQQQQQQHRAEYTDALRERVKACAKRYMGALEDRVESLLMSLYREGLPSLDRQLSAEQAVQRMLSTGPSATNSRRMRRASVAPQLQQYGANTKPLPGFESHKANKDNLVRMTRDTTCLSAIIASVSIFNSEDNRDVDVNNPGARLHARIERTIVDHLRRTIITDVIAAGNITANNEGFKSLVCKPSQLAAELEQLKSLLSLFGGSDFVHPEALLANALEANIALKGPRNSAAGERATFCSVFSDWYTAIVVLNVKRLDIMYSPLTNRFEHVDGKGNKTINVADFTSIRELQHLLDIFGISIIDAIDASLSRILSECVHLLDSVLHSNVQVLDNLFSNNGGGGGSDQDFERILNIASKLVQGQRALDAVTRIGVILNFRGMMRSAARGMLLREFDAGVLAFIDGARDLIDAIPGTLTRSAEFLGPKSLLETFLSKSKGDMDCKLLAAMSHIGTITDKTWQLLPNLLAVLLPMVHWGTLPYSKHHEGFANNVHCMFSAVVPLMYASFVSSVCAREAKLPTAHDATSRRKLEQSIDDAIQEGLCTYIRVASLCTQHFRLPNTVLPFLHDKIARKCTRERVLESSLPHALLLSGGV